MGMQVGSSEGDDAVIASINTTPLVDVMLVLLIIFLITIPVVTTSVPVQLPKERIEARETKPENIVISVNQAGKLFWYDEPLANHAALMARLRPVAAMTPQPEVQVRGDMAARYEGVGRVLFACQTAGVAKVSFITEPPPNGG
ncbi:ExbD/TolR family protein [Variovorax paradoxus]|uniref:Biopolymer transport protein ExbD n=1 Tax=Variovorax paradoxus TaxID=34073 RepID=A0A0H2M4Y6_VARPD|nr:biopolymer transporter ExbD [Variovorax paradoxus]KLN57414.1 biopolymer transport protein ExbD [Variovorax paradoxus]